MKRKNIAMTIVVALFIIAGIRSLWNIDIAMASALSGGRIVTITGFQDLNFFYHQAMLLNLFAFIGLSVLCLYLFAEYHKIKGALR